MKRMDIPTEERRTGGALGKIVKPDALHVGRVSEASEI